MTKKAYKTECTRREKGKRKRLERSSTLFAGNEGMEDICWGESIVSTRMRRATSNSISQDRT